MKNICYLFLFLFFLFSLSEGCCQIPNLPDSPYSRDYANYITIQNKRFMNGNNPFKPLCINYLVDYVQFKQSGTWFVSPLLNYSDEGGNGGPIIVNGDAIDELLCVQITNGNNDWMQVMKFSSDIPNWITLWTNNGQNASNSWDWSWSTYESGRLSDLQVSSNLNVFFIRALSKVPDYLFVHRWISSNYSFDAYSYDL